MSATAKTTTNHAVIRRWVEQRGGCPAHVKGPGADDDPGILRIDFPGFSGENLEALDWDVWFQAFDDNELAFLYEEQTADGQESRFNKIVSRDSAAAQVPGH